jgi:hypothetical protein
VARGLGLTSKIDPVAAAKLAEREQTWTGVRDHEAWVCGRLRGVARKCGSVTKITVFHPPRQFTVFPFGNR